MSDVCGIFYKSCPQCAMAVAKSAMGCQCGYSFEEETPTSAMAQSLAEEKLYEDYLLARVTQTAQAAIDAQAAQKRQPADTSLNIAALTAMELAETARRDLAAQSARVEELRQAVAAEATIKLPAATPAPAVPAHSPAAINAAASAAEVPVPASARAAEVARAAEALRSELAKLRHPDERAAGNNPALTPARVLRASEQRSDPRPVKERAPTRNANAGETHRDITSEPARSETRTSARDAHAPAAVAPTNPVAKKNCPQCDAAVIASANRCRCGFAFVAHVAPANVPKIEDVLARAQELKQARRESAQAQKAARIREARLARAAAKPAPATPGVVAVTEAPRAETAQTQPTPTAKPGPAALSPTLESELSASVAGTVVPIEKSGSGRQRAASLSPARPLVTAARDVKECPNCTANVAAHASRCNCGFEFRDVSATSPMPALRLDDGELLKVQDLYVRR